MVGTRSGKVRPNTEIGRLLLKARRFQNISIEDASKALNISSNHLNALEEGDFSVFAAEIYARGAYIKYAEYLGVDHSRFERDILKTLSGAREIVPLRLHTPRSLLDRLLTPTLIFSMIALCIALSIGGYIAWQVDSFLQVPSLEAVEAKVSGDSVMVHGLSEEQAHIKINGESVLLREDNSFELAIYLRPGVNVIRIEAENAAGRKSVIEKHVLYPSFGEDLLANEESVKLQ